MNAGFIGSNLNTDAPGRKSVIKTKHVALENVLEKTPSDVVDLLSTRPCGTEGNLFNTIRESDEILNFGMPQIDLCNCDVWTTPCKS